jgi:hypothetical protein
MYKQTIHAALDPVDWLFSTCRPRFVGLWDYNIKMDVKAKIWLCGLDSSALGQGPVASSFEYVIEPLGSVKDGEFL